MKPFKILLILATLWMAGSVCNAAITVPSEEGKAVEYTLSYDAAIVTESSAVNQAIEGALTIPDAVEYNGSQYPVIRIGKEAFKGNTRLTSVTIGNNVTHVNESAFEGCSNLESVTFGTGLVRIDKSGFYACAKLKSVVFPDGLKSFGPLAFAGSGLEGELVIPSSVTLIEQGAFRASTHIKSVSFLSSPDIQAEAFDYCNGIEAYYFLPSVLRPIIRATNALAINTGTKLYVSQATISMLANGWASGTVLQQKYNNDANIFVAYDSTEGAIFMHQLAMTNGEGNSVGSLALCFTVTSTDEQNPTAALYCPPSTGYSAGDILKSGSNAVIKNALTDDVKLVFPETVTDQSGKTYTVTAIGAGAFGEYASNYYTHITNLKIPSTITHIGVQAFRYLSELKGNLIIPATVQQIGHPDVARADIFYRDYYGTHKVDGVYMMHTSASDIDWYETQANNYFAYSGNNETSTYLYVCQEIYDKAYGKNGAVRYLSTSAFRSWLISNYWNGGSHVALFDPATLGLKWSTEQTIVDISGEYEAPELKNPFGLAVTYGSSNPDVAAIDEDGTITLGTAEGPTTLTATFTGDDEYPVTTPLSVQTVIIRRGEPKLAENQTNQNQYNTCVALTKLTTWSPNARLYMENNMWDMPHMMDGIFYVSAYWQSGNDRWSSDCFNDYLPYDYLQLSCTPAFLSPNYGLYYDDGGTNVFFHDGQPGTTLGGFICFKVKGPGTIKVRGFTDSDNAKMGICVQGNTPLLISGTEDREVAYDYALDADAEAYAYIYGASLSPDRHGYIKYVKFIPQDTEMVDVSIGGIAIEEENDDITGNGTIGFEWREDEETDEPAGSRRLGPDDPEGGDTPAHSTRYPVLILNNATLTSDNGPAIEVNSHDRFVIELRGKNTIKTTDGSAAISMGTMQSADYWGGGNISIVGLEKGASLTVKDGESGIYLVESSVHMENFTADINGSDYGIRFKGFDRYDYDNAANCNLTLGKGMSLKMRGDQEAISGFSPMYMDNLGYEDEETGNWMRYELLESDLEGARHYYGVYGVEEQEWVEDPENSDEGEWEYIFTPAKYLSFGIPPTEVTVNIGSYGMATFCSNYDLNFTDINNVKAYIVSGFDGINTLTLTRVYEVPKGTGLVLYSTNGGAATATVPIEYAYSYYEQMLVGCTVDKYIAPTTTITVTEDGESEDYTYTNFVMSVKNGEAGFYRFNVDDSGKRKVEKGKAYLRLKDYTIPEGGGEARALSVRFEDDDTATTGISDSKRVTTDDSRYYNLNGQQVDAPQKGLYIKNGKKIVVK